MHALSRSLSPAIRASRLLTPLALRRHAHHPPPAADISEWIAYFAEKDARLDRAYQELDVLKARLEKMEGLHVQSEEEVGKLRTELGKRKLDYSMLTAVELVVEAAYRNGSITADLEHPPSVIVHAIAELKKDPLLVSIVEEACLKLDMQPEEAWEQLPTLYDRLAKKAGLMDALRFSSGYDLMH
ncbi:hypothetical protein CALVIDRAFT_598123 [Calocera viscosa TUFC12733]|uniref:Uncharacterized protein n=1 Tax=Calocera viscosa (strain TUFC12733) TaxID=1330018 RepID=A0A167MBM4_CALVF|nr:hypothetical protein CALVIDRAFT_598123 [Calocera viscosa TUFC12733]